MSNHDQKTISSVAAIAITVICMLITPCAHAGDVEIDLNSADGSTDFELRDSGGNIQFDVDSDGNTTWPQGADDSDLTVPTYAGNPDTVITAPEGSVAYDTTGNTLYVNTDGATNWEALADGGGGGSAVVAGSNQQVQYNTAGAFGAEAGFAYNASTDTLTAVNATFTTINNAAIGATTPADATFTALAVDTNVLYVDPNSDNVGIGTTGPGASLDINGNALLSGSNRRMTLGNWASITGMDSGSALVAENFYSDGFPNYRYTNTHANIGYAGIILAPGTFPGEIQFVGAIGATTAGATFTPTVNMVIKSTGNIGIGAIAPEKKLHVAGTLTATDATFETINNAQIGNSAARDATFTDITVTGSINGTVGSSSAGDATFTALNVTTGNVGIGTTTPGSTLPTGFVSTNAGLMEIRSKADASDVGLFLRDSDGGPGIDIWADNNIGKAYVDSLWNDDTWGGFVFRTKTLGTPVEALTVQGDGDVIVNSGNVGIGVTDPDTKLEIIGGVTAVDATFSGNVGIGTTTPVASLHVAEGAFAGIPLFERTGANSDAIWAAGRLMATKTSNMADDFGTGLWFYIQDDAAVENPIASMSASRSGADNSGKLELQTYDAGSRTTKMTIIPDGNVGIGTATPGEKLEVIGDGMFLGSAADAEGIKLHTDYANADTASRVLFAERNDDVYGFSVVYAGSADPTLGGSTLTGLPQNTFNIVRHENSAAGVAALTIERGNGEIGIGVTDPDKFLEVAGNMSALDATFAALAVDTNVLYVDPNSNNVGIGTTAPAAGLEVYPNLKISNSGTAILNINADNAGSNALIVFEEQDGAKAFIVHDASNDALALSDGAYSETVTIKSDNVGIGVTDPDQKLEIAGVFKAVPTDAPGTCNAGAEGAMYMDDSLNEPCFCNGTGWTQFDGGGAC